MTNPPVPASLETPTERLRLCFELHEVAVAMLRQSFRRKHPEADEADVEAAVRDWHARRPGAEHGDCEGRRLAWPRAG